MKLRLGTRGSALALVQSNFARDRLLSIHSDLEIEIVVIKTTGDVLSERVSAVPDVGTLDGAAPSGAGGPPPGPGAFGSRAAGIVEGKGIFIKEIEEALLDRRVDFAVHSLKDLPTDLSPGLFLSAVMEREDPRDCVVSRFGEQLLELPRGAVVGTGSFRRQAQILAAKKSIRVRDMRGNLDTRVKKVMNGDADAIVVALAGMRRLKKEDDVSEILSTDVMLPAPAQGCLGIETRAGDEGTVAVVSKLNHEPSARAAAAERSFLASLGGGCRVPIAAYAREDNGRFILDGLVISPDGRTKKRGRVEGNSVDGISSGKALAEKLLAEGAGEILRSLIP